MKLTKKQKQLVDFIDGFTKGQGYSPTFREIMQALGYKSVSTVAKHVDNLVAIGALIKRDGQARSLEVCVDDAPVPSDVAQPWWTHLEKEIDRRQTDESDEVQQEVAILRQALDIVRTTAP